MTTNGFGLAEEEELISEMLNKLQIAQFTISAPFWQTLVGCNAFFLSIYSFNKFI